MTEVWDRSSDQGESMTDESLVTLVEEGPGEPGSLQDRGAITAGGCTEVKDSPAEEVKQDHQLGGNQVLGNNNLTEACLDRNEWPVKRPVGTENKELLSIPVQASSISSDFGKVALDEHITHKDSETKIEGAGFHFNDGVPEFNSPQYVVNSVGDPGSCNNVTFSEQLSLTEEDSTPFLSDRSVSICHSDERATSLDCTHATSLHYAELTSEASETEINLSANYDGDCSPESSENVLPSENSSDCGMRSPHVNNKSCESKEEIESLSSNGKDLLSDIFYPCNSESTHKPNRESDLPLTETLQGFSEAACLTSSEGNSSEEESPLSENEMGKKSGSFSKKSSSFSKKNGGLYSYSKDEFRESYHTKPKPKPARRFTFSHRERSDKTSISQKTESESPIYDSPPLGPPGGSQNGRVSSGSPQSPDGVFGPPTSPSSNHPYMSLEDVDKNGNVQRKSKPTPAPRRSLSSTSSLQLVTHKTVVEEDIQVIPELQAQKGHPGSEDTILQKEGLNVDAHEDADMTENRELHESISPAAVSPKSPDLSEIMCITRTVDGEEELILGAAPMFANQQKLTMDSARDASRSLQDQDGINKSSGSGSVLAESAKGFKNYAYIEPVDQPVESQRVELQQAVTLKQVDSLDSGKNVPVEEPRDKSDLKDSAVDASQNVATKNNHVTALQPKEETSCGDVESDVKGGNGDDDEDEDRDNGVNDAAYRLSDWMYLGTKRELDVVNGGAQKEEDNGPEVEVDLKDSPTLKPASSIDSLETTSSEREFKDQFSSMSLRKVKREGSILGYRKVTDITREREMQITFDESAKSFGFRIQYSKPAIVTEVDAGGAAEKKGLIVGDVVLAVNGTDVRKAPHASVVKLVQTGGKELRLLVGTNMCNSPNRDLCKPIKTGYMHKLGGQGMFKNWKRRWFVLKHDGCLYYYKTENDVDPLGAVVLTNYTLMRARDVGKQHAFKITKYKARTYYFYADTETDMNSWAKSITEAAQKKTNSDVWLDISTHNVGLPALSIKSPDCRGYLTKQGLVHKNWKKRYCVLKDACMYYYTDIKQPRALGIVHFHGYKIQETELAGKKYGFMLVPPLPELRTYYFISDNETDRKRWVASLASSIGRWIQTNEEDEFSQSENREQEMLI